MENRRYKFILLCLILAAIFVSSTALHSLQNKKPADSVILPVVEAKVAPPELKAGSPDGKMLLVINKVENKSNAVWVFKVNGSEIFKETLQSNVVVTLPLNTFSPDNKYFFIKETSPETTSYKAFFANGKPMLTDSVGLDFSEPFVTKNPNFVITDVTGWAAPNLLIINTDKASGGQGPSFWFNVVSKSITQLSTRFN